MEGEEKKEELCYPDNIKELVIKELSQFSNGELDKDDLDTIYKLVDIDKDLENIDYWNCKKEVLKMRYGNYGNYGEYSDGEYGNYGRYDRYGREKYGRPHDVGEEMLNDMRDSYGAYSESMSAYSRGNYGAGQEGMKALEDTMRLFTDFAQKMIRETESPEAKQIIKKHLRKISQMSEA